MGEDNLYRVNAHRGYYAFLANRIGCGRMHPVAFSRANRIFRQNPAIKPALLGDPPVSAQDKVGALSVSRISLALAGAYVTQHHRHHSAPVGHLFSIGLWDDVGLRGVAIVGRPLARNLDDGKTIEVLRLCSDGTRNACSKLYGAVRREAIKLGNVQRIVTYTLPEEGGASLKASGFECIGESRGGSWSRSGRERTDRHPTGRKIRWQILLR